MSNSQIPLADFLDLVDTVSTHQRALHRHLEVGFLALAREGYRNSASSIRIANAATAEADSFVTSDGELVMTKSGSSLAPVPSAELRGAINAFRAALGEVVRLVQARKKVLNIHDEDIIVTLDTDNLDIEPIPHNNKVDGDTVTAEAGIEGDTEVEGKVEINKQQEDEWTLVR